MPRWPACELRGSRSSWSPIPAACIPPADVTWARYVPLPSDRNVRIGGLQDPDAFLLQDIGCRMSCLGGIDDASGKRRPCVIDHRLWLAREQIADRGPSFIES